MNFLADESIDRQIVARPRQDGHLGTLLVRLAGVAPERKAALVASVIAQRSEELLGAFAVLTPRSLRIRRLE